MKNNILICIFTLVHSFVVGQDQNHKDSGRNKIYIIGVVHSANEFRNSDSLFNILKDIQPNLILAETDTLSGYFKADYTLVEPPNWYKMARKLKMGRKMPPEMEVLYSYLNYDATIKIFPFDIPIINRKASVASDNRKETEWVTSVNKAYFGKRIPSHLLPLFEQCLQSNNFYISLLDKSYSTINKTSVSDSIRLLMAMEKELNPQLVETLPELNRFREWQVQNTADWLHRNEVMVKNIIRFTERTQAKKVVVLTGLLHKYILTDILNTYNSEGKYAIVEYFDK